MYNNYGFGNLEIQASDVTTLMPQPVHLCVVFFVAGCVGGSSGPTGSGILSRVAVRATLSGFRGVQTISLAAED